MLQVGMRVRIIKNLEVLDGTYNDYYKDDEGTIQRVSENFDYPYWIEIDNLRGDWFKKDEVEEIK